MPRFRVDIPEIHTATIEVDARDSMEAVAKAKALYDNLGDSINVEYSHTQDIGEWEAFEQ